MPQVEAGKIICEVIDYNRFGNILLNVRAPDLEAAGLQDEPDLAIEALAGGFRLGEARPTPTSGPASTG